MKYMVNSKPSIDNIGNAIREKLNTSTTYTIDQMPDAIRSIETGSSGGSGQIHTINNVSIIRLEDCYEPALDQNLFNEIVEYYAAGYQVLLNFATLDNYVSPDGNPWYVAHVYDNIYSASNYDRISGAVICLISSTIYETESSSGNTDSSMGIGMVVVRGSSNYTIDEMYFY